jgi:hypothetical protein
VLRFKKKGVKDREIPVRHDLAAWLNGYIEAAGITEEGSALPRGQWRAQNPDIFSLRPSYLVNHFERTVSRRS